MLTGKMTETDEKEFSILKDPYTQQKVTKSKNMIESLILEQQQKREQNDAVAATQWTPPAKHTFVLNGVTYQYRYGKYYKLLKTHSEVGDSFGPYQNFPFPDPLNQHL